VGESTANYVLIQTFRNPDSIPFGDIGIYQALENYNLLSNRKDRQAIQALFDKFPGWGSYLTIYLWRSLANP